MLQVREKEAEITTWSKVKVQQLCVAGDQSCNHLGLLSRVKVDVCPSVCIAGDQRYNSLGCPEFVDACPTVLQVTRDITV